MIDKIDRLKKYISYIERLYLNMYNRLQTANKNLILISVNTPYVVNSILSRLQQTYVEIDVMKHETYNNYASLGSYLRESVSKNEYTKDVIVLDFSTIEDGRCKEIAKEININRDLFGKIYNSTIVFASNELTHTIMLEAIDFWSCVECYVDTTKWFCMPVMLPLIKVRTFNLPSYHLVEIYKNQTEEYEKYIHLKQKICDFKTYNHKNFVELYKEINEFEKNVCYYDLLIQFIDQVANNRAPENTYKQRLNDIESLKIICSNYFDNTQLCLELIDVYFIIAEFYYRCERYSESRACYQIAQYIMMELWRDKNAKFVCDIIGCNIQICRYLEKNEHAPNTLLHELKDRFIDSNGEDINRYKSFIETYLFSVSSTVEHHTYTQHADIFDDMQTFNKPDLGFVDINETYNIILLWEKYLNEKIIDENGFSSVYYDINIDCLKMIQNYCKGENIQAEKFYDKARRKAKNYNYMFLYRIIGQIKDNVKYLRKQTIKGDAFEFYEDKNT